MSAQRFDRVTAEKRLGPAAVTAAKSAADSAPPLSIETRARLRALFETARTARLSARGAHRAA